MAAQVGQRVGRVDYAKLWWVSGAVGAVAVAANLAVQAGARALFAIPNAFLPLTPGPTGVFTVGGVLGAVALFTLLDRFVSQPLRRFRQIALVALLLSFIPDLLLLQPSSPFGQVSMLTVIVLMIEHVVAWFICVQGLTRWASR